jgi:hypothetical protein
MIKSEEMIEDQQVGRLSSTSISRRKLMQGAAILAGGTAASSLATLPAVAAPTKGLPTDVMVGTSSAETVVETSSGKVRGFIRNDIYTFKGMP